ncbi:MAG: phage virion morphogenesis protein [Candidatus Thermoplasmatota archaeon]|nr:phage virion morphogenesis protein [Candidatus Thermoplasmatota archaeon]
MVEAKLEGQDGVQAWLEDIDRRAGDISPIADQIVGAFLDDNRANWNRGWEDLSPAYAAWKAKHYPTAGVLELTGTLKKSLTARTGDTIVRKEPGGVKVGTRVPYAAYHQEGTKNLPPRPPMALSDAFIDKLEEIISDFVGGAG